MELSSTMILLLFSVLVLSASARFPHQQRLLARRAIKVQPADPSPPYSVQYVHDQKVDHFNASDSRTFSTRYLFYDKYCDHSSGPLFVYTGNEGDIVWFFENTGFMVQELSQKFNALIVFIEHRYYGESLPFGPDSYKDAEHLKFLSSKQALADFKYVIEQIKDQFSPWHGPVIAVGGSYGGMLAAWFRMKYPDVVVGSLAASAPIWWFPDLTPCNSAYVTVTRDFHEVDLPSNTDCSDIVRQSWGAISSLAKQDGGLKTLSDTFSLCTPLKTMDDVETLMDWLEDTWFNLAMVDYPYSANFLEPLPLWPINVTCWVIYATLQKPQMNVVDAIAEGVRVYYNWSGQAKCLNTSETATSSVGLRGWDYQSCSEMVMPMCSNGVTDMFREHKWNFSQYAKDCEEKFGVMPQPDMALNEYGGKNISNHTNIIFSNGLLDPWHGGGVMKSLSKTLIAIVLDKGAHHLDLRGPQDNDPSYLTQVRKEEMDIMKGWINEHTYGPNSDSRFRCPSPG